VFELDGRFLVTVTADESVTDEELRTIAENLEAGDPSTALEETPG
jgi:hypothetical protein